MNAINVLPYSHSPLNAVMLIMQPSGIKRAQRLETENLDVEHGSPTYMSIAFTVKNGGEKKAVHVDRDIGGFSLTGILEDIGGYLIDILMFILWLGDDFLLLQIHLTLRMIFRE